jgi:antibiotic biosynthesis monooxygenase (ABM) superfamily enzyme
MSSEAKYLYMVMMDVEPDKEEIFNQLYNDEHVPVLLEVPGVLGAARYETASEGVPRYVAVYELENPDVPNSEAWRKAADSGEWPHKARPFTKNQRRVLYKRIGP